VCHDPQVITEVPGPDGPPPDDPPGAGRPAGSRGADGCAGCGSPTRPRPGGSQLVAGRPVAREIGSCRRCGLQLVRFVGEPWREIRG
jgi:hypothetical protein